MLVRHGLRRPLSVRRGRGRSDGKVAAQRGRGSDSGKTGASKYQMRFLTAPLEVLQYEQSVLM